MTRYVHRKKATGKFAVSHGSWVSYTGSLEEAKIYRTRNGGSKGYGETDDDYEWIEVDLALRLERPIYTHPDGGFYRILTEGSLKHPDTGVWYDAVTYQDVATGKVYTTEVSRWRARFTLEDASK